MKTLKSSLWAIALLFLCTACFEIQEKVHVHDDGSGTYAFQINMEKMKSMLEMMDNMKQSDDEEGVLSVKTNKSDSVTQNMNNSFDSLKQVLENIKGIHNAKTIEDKEHFVFGVQFDFDNEEALNKGVNVVMKEKDPHQYFKISKHKVERLDPVNIAKQIQDDMKQGEEGDSTQMQMQMNVSALFGDVAFTSECTVDSKVKDVTNDKAMLSADQKSVVVKSYIFREDATPLEYKVSW